MLISAVTSAWGTWRWFGASNDDPDGTENFSSSSSSPSNGPRAAVVGPKEKRNRLSLFLPLPLLEKWKHGAPTDAPDKNEE
jgi:hypothetical protein